MSFGPAYLAGRLEELLPHYAEAHFCVAFSGGADSTALLAALARLPSLRARVRALHVNHQLQPAAASWSRHCRRIARSLGVPITVRRVRIGPLRGASPEAAARNARYEALGRALRPEEVLLTAHQQDDQLETVLLQLLRGAGPAGLAAMPECARFSAGLLVRPLLELPRAALCAWLRAQSLGWIEDDSNRTLQHDRNYLRLKVLPLIRARWPGAGATVARSARLAAEARLLLESLGAADAERAAVGAGLAAPVLRTLTPERRRNALRYWIAHSGVRVPDSRRLAQIAGPLLSARKDAHPHVRWSEGEVLREGALLRLRAPPARPLQAPTAVQTRWAWQRQSRCVLPAPLGTLSLRRDPRGPLDLDALAAVLWVRTRTGGERLTPVRGGPRRTLKGLLQEAHVPVEERAYLPLLYAGARLVAAADRWLDVSVHADSASRRRARLIWSAPVRG